MKNPRGRIIAVKHSDPAVHALVEVDAAVQCKRCAEGKGCGAGLFGTSAATRRVEALVREDISVGEGDEVRIALEPRNLLRASLIVYGLPLGFAVGAAAFAYFAGLGDLGAALAALVGVAGGLLVARSQLRRSGCLRELTPTVVERIAVQQRPVGT